MAAILVGAMRSSTASTRARDSQGRAIGGCGVGASDIGEEGVRREAAKTFNTIAFSAQKFTGRNQHDFRVPEIR